MMIHGVLRTVTSNLCSSPAWPHRGIFLLPCVISFVLWGPVLGPEWWALVLPATCWGWCSRFGRRGHSYSLSYAAFVAFVASPAFVSSGDVFWATCSSTLFCSIWAAFAVFFLPYLVWVKACFFFFNLIWQDIACLTMRSVTPLH